MSSRGDPFEIVEKYFTDNSNSADPVDGSGELRVPIFERPIVMGTNLNNTNDVYQ